MSFEDFGKLVKERQACRDFSDEPLALSDIEKIVELARFTPSACNSQPWKLYCVTSKSVVSAVAEALQDGGRNTFVAKAKAFIAVAETSAKLKPDVEKRFASGYFVKYDVGEMLAYITLGAKSLGIDTCILGWMNKEKLRSTLGFKEGEDCSVVVALGHSDIPVREKVRKEKRETVEFI